MIQSKVSRKRKSLQAWIEMKMAMEVEIHFTGQKSISGLLFVSKNYSKKCLDPQTFPNYIISAGNKPNKEKHEAMLLESDSSDVEDADTLTSRSNSNSSSTPSTLTLEQGEPSGQNVEKIVYNSRLSLDSKMKSQSMDSHGLDMRHTQSVQYPMNASTSSIREHSFEHKENPNASASNEQRFHRKIVRGDDISYGVMSKGRYDRREERRRLIAERSAESRSIFGSTGHDSIDRRGSEDLVSDPDYRRGSRDSNTSGRQSPSHSSQDSLFDTTRAYGHPTAQASLTQSLSYGNAPPR